MCARELTKSGHAVPLPPCYALSLFTTLSARRTINQHLAPIPSESPRPNDPVTNSITKPQRATVDYSGLQAMLPERERRREECGTDESTRREMEETVSRWREEQKKWTLSLEKAAAASDREKDDLEDAVYNQI